MGHGRAGRESAEILAADKGHEIKAVFATHNETATGVTSDIAGVRKAINDAKHPALLFVDGVSSVGCLDFRMEEWGVDCCVSGSQKGFMMPAGLGILAVSDELSRPTSPRSGALLLLLRGMLKNNDLGYFPYPGDALLRGLRDALDLIDAEASPVSARHARLAEASAARCRLGAEALRARPEWHSNTVTAISFPKARQRARHEDAFNRWDLSLGSA